MVYKTEIAGIAYRFNSFGELLAKASPARSGDILVGVAADSNLQRVAAQWVLADVPLKQFLLEALIPCATDDVSCLIFQQHDQQAFALVSHLTVGGFRDWLLSDASTSEILQQLAWGLTPELVAAVSKLMRIQNFILVARKYRVVTQFRNTPSKT